MTDPHPGPSGSAAPPADGLFDGLRRRAVSRADLTAHSLAVVCPTVSALGVGFALPWWVGPGAWLSVVLGFGLTYLLALCFGEFASRLRTPGSLYTWVAKGLGPGAALMVGVSLILGYAALTCFGLTGAARRGEAGVAALSGVRVSPSADLVVVGLGVVVCVLVMLRGIRWSTRFAFGVEGVALVLLAAILVVTVERHGMPTPAVLSLAGADPHAVLLGALTIMGVTVAFESGSTLAVEAEQPYRSVPRSLSDTVLLTGGLLLLTTLVSAAAKAHGEVAPEIAWRWFAPGETRSLLDGIALLVLAVSFIACAVCAWTALTRVLLAFAREGIVWRRLGETTLGGIPVVGIVVTVPLVVAPVGVSLLMGERPGWMSMQMLQVAVLLMMVVYGLGAVAVIGFLHRIDELRPRAVAVAVSAALLMLLMAGLQIEQDITEGHQRVVLVLGVVVAAGLLWRRSLRRSSSLPRVGAHDATRVSEMVLATPPGFARD